MTEPTADPDQSAAAGSRRNKAVLLILLLLVVIAGVYGIYWYTVQRFNASTDDAYVESNPVTLTPQTAGTVVSVRVNNTDYVQQGELLARLDDTDAGIAYAEAQANLAKSVRDVQQLFDAVQLAKANVNAAQSTLDQAERDYARNKRMQQGSAVSEQLVQHAYTEVLTGKAALDQAQSALAQRQDAVVGTTVSDHPSVKLAEARLRAAYIDLQRTRILAPVSGYVANRNVQLGTHVAPGTPLLSIVPLDDVWVDANFKETDLARVCIGQSVSLRADIYGGSTQYQGTVVGIGAGTGSAFALLPAQNATGNWIKVVQRIPVRIALDNPDLKRYPLRVGASMVVNIDTHSCDQNAKGNPVTPVSTNTYQIDQSKVDALIERIVKANSRPWKS